MSSAGFSKIKNLIVGALSLLNPKKWGVFQEAYSVTKFDAAFTPSWSQGAEDLAIENLLLADCSSHTYIDIGAHHPNRFSVTRRLYQNGWHGINVDANGSVREIFESKRPRDIFIHAAVGSQKEYLFSEYAEGAISTVDADWKSKFAAQGHVPVKEYAVPGKSLRDILEMLSASGRVDLLTIDIEGADFEALSSLNLESLAKDRHPRWLLLETSPPLENALKTPAVELAINNGYIPYLVLPMATLLRASS